MDDDQPKNTETKKISSYRDILKGTSYFGGVQILNIIVTLIRGKFVAVILGPEGMGINSLFNSASNTIQRLSSLGANQSALREIAATDDITEKNLIISSSLKLFRITSLLGLLICVAFCVPLSRLTFGNSEMWWQFMILGAAVFFGIYSAGELSVLQALHEVKKISRASIVGSLSGLIIGVPLYYIFGFIAIVPAILAITLALFIFYSYNLHKCGIKAISLFSWNFNKEIIRKILLLGIVLMAGDLITTLFGYIINLFVRIYGSMDEVGLYQAANSVTNQYAGIIFSALAMDYFPRLSKVADNNSLMTMTVNRQSEVVAWLITPAMTLLILTTPLLIRVLLAESFHQISPLMRWMGLGMMLRAFSFPMAYITFAKGNKKVFFMLEGVTANVMTLTLSCLGFYFFGLIGLGYALVADNAFCIILYYFVNNRLYGYKFSSGAAYNYVAGALLVCICFFAAFIPNPWISYIVMSLSSLIAIIWSVINLKAKIKNIKAA